MAPSPLSIAVLSASAAVFLTPRVSSSSSLYSHAGVAFILFLILQAAKYVYSIILYPIYFTPFKDIATPARSHNYQGGTLINGHFDQFISKGPGMAILKWAQEFPDSDLIRFYLLGNQERLIVNSLKGLSEVFVHKAYDFVKPAHFQFTLGRVSGESGLLLVEGDVHKTHRKHLNPAFAFRHIKDLYPVFWGKSVEMVQRIEDSLKALPADKKVVEIRGWASRATLDIIGLAGMDNDFGSLENPNNSLNVHYRNIVVDPPRHIQIIQGISFFIYPKLVHTLPIAWNRNIIAGAKAIRAESRRMIAQKQAQLDKKETMGIDILSVAMQSGGFTEENLVDQMMTFLLAGHETTANALQWVVYALCKHQSIQTRLREEIRENLPSSLYDEPSTLTASNIDSLPYLNAVCSEVLRFYPPVPLTVREACRDTSIANHPIPKGTVVIMSPETTNRNVEYWGPDAGIFNPERWLAPGKANTGGAESIYAFQTFIYGPRNCIGQGFSRSELACLVAAMVGRFEMELEDPEKELEIKGGVTQSPKDGVRTRIKVLERW
ncbi:hypothetical protein FQN54_001620 [Arachnomyces sp. PD_36]|nr:hypothetical protein FQN54_001620 [Arachnomyces sp. PD_36]